MIKIMIMNYTKKKTEFSIYKQNEIQCMIIGDNWGAVLAENWSDGEPNTIAPTAPRGFPLQVPSVETPPEFEWIQRGADSAKQRRLDYERSIPAMTPLISNRRPGLGKHDIDQEIYSRRQDEENRHTSRIILKQFFFLLQNYPFLVRYIGKITILKIHKVVEHMLHL